MNRTAAQLARLVADERGLLVAGDLGPTDELLAPLGTLAREEAQALFAEQLIALVEGGDAVTHLAAAGADAVGANCGRGPEEMEIIAAEMVHSRTGDLLLVAQSNAGLPQLVGDHLEYDTTADDLAAHATRLAELGIDLVVGCCGSTPAHIAAMAAILTPA